MKRKKGHRRGRVALLCAAAVLAFSALSGTAFAETDDVGATVTGGSLIIAAALDAGTFSTTLDGTAQTLSGTGFSNFDITDARGTGVGWSVTMQATVFDNGTLAGKDLATNSLTAPLFSVTKIDESSSAVPGTLHAAATIDTGSSGVVMVACSAFAQGMGKYRFSADASAWKLAVPAHAYRGTYTSTITTTLATLALTE